MQAKSFIDILAHELRKEIRAEFEAELASSRASNFSAAPSARAVDSAKAEQVHLWLNLKIGGAIAQPSRKSAYGVRRSYATATASEIRQLPPAGAASSEEIAERVGRAVTIEQTLALEFFVREGSSLTSKFTEAELKSEFRKIALRIHPDRHTDASADQLKSLSARFQSLVESAEILETTLL